MLYQIELRASAIPGHPPVLVGGTSEGPVYRRLPRSRQRTRYPAPTSMEARRPQLADLGVFLLVVAAPLVFTPFSESPFGDPKLVLVVAAALALWGAGLPVDRRLAWAGAAWAGATLLGALFGLDPSRGLTAQTGGEGGGLVVVVVCRGPARGGGGRRRRAARARAPVVRGGLRRDRGLRRAGAPRAGDVRRVRRPVVRGRHDGEPDLRRGPALGRARVRVRRARRATRAPTRPRGPAHPRRGHLRRAERPAAAGGRRGRVPGEGALAVAAGCGDRGHGPARDRHLAGRRHADPHGRTRGHRGAGRTGHRHPALHDLAGAGRPRGRRAPLARLGTRDEPVRLPREGHRGRGDGHHADVGRRARPARWRRS